MFNRMQTKPFAKGKPPSKEVLEMEEHLEKMHTLIARHYEDDAGFDLRGPTQHPPGTPWKAAVLSARDELGLPLYVAGDATEHPEPPHAWSTPQPRPLSAYSDAVPDVYSLEFEEGAIDGD